MKHFRGTFFDLDYPAEWEVEIIENIPCFYDPDGAGVFQVAAFRHREGGTFDALSELSSYMERHGIQLDAEKAVLFDLPSGLRAAACEFIREERFWLANCVIRGDRMVLALWNGDSFPDQDTAGRISQTVMSLRFRD